MAEMTHSLLKIMTLSILSFTVDRERAGTADAREV